MLENVTSPPIRNSDMAIFIPMDEEFLVVREIIPCANGFIYKGHAHHWLPSFGSLRNVMFLCPNCQGPEDALSAAHHLFSNFAITSICVIGIAGALNHDLKLGDVALADIIADYGYRQKTVDGSQGYHVRQGGREWPLPNEVQRILRQIRVGAPELYDAWQSESYAEMQSRNEISQCRRPRAHVGKIASGPSVIASRQYANELLVSSRLYLACEMESAGIVS